MTISSAASLGAFATAVAAKLTTSGERAYSYAYSGDPATGVPLIDLAKASGFADCSGWVSFALNSVAPLHEAIAAAHRTEDKFNQGEVAASGGDKVLLAEAADWGWARAEVLTDLFAHATGGNGFSTVADFADLQAGDVIAYSLGLYSDPTGDPATNHGLVATGDTGHTMIVTGTPVAVTDPATLAVHANLSPDVVAVYAVPVVDSSDLRHFKSPQPDDRDYVVPQDAPAGSKGGGIGTGSMWFGVDAAGHAVQFCFGATDGWQPPYGGGAACKIAAARLSDTIDLGSADLQDGKLVVRVYPDAAATLDGTSYAVSEHLTGTGGIKVTGGGTLVLGTGNTFQGQTEVDGGSTLTIAASDALGAAENGVVLDAGATLGFSAGFAFDHGLSLAGESATVDLEGNSVQLSGGLTLQPTAVLTLASTKAGGELTLGDQVHAPGTIQVGNGAVLKLTDASGTPNTVGLLDGGTLHVHGSVSLPHLLVSGQASLALSDGATLQLTAGTGPNPDAKQIGVLSVTGSGTLELDAGSVTLSRLTGGATLYTGTLQQFDGTTLAGFKAGDVLDMSGLLTTADTKGMTTGVTAKYDATTGLLTVTRGDASAAIKLAPGLDRAADGTAEVFTVHTDGMGGAIIDVEAASGTQNADALHATQVRASGGPDGKGVTVGIISDSFNTRGGMAQDIANGYLPADTQVIGDAPFVDSDEGREMGRIVHAVAPGAAIRFAASGTGSQGLAYAITALANTPGVNVIVDDVTVFDDGVYQPGGPIEAAISYARSKGITLLTSAANEGRNFYEHALSLRPATSGPVAGTYAYDFNLGQGAPRYLQELDLTPSSKGDIRITLGWDQPASGSAFNLGISVFQKVGDDYQLVSQQAKPDPNNASVRTVTVEGSKDGGTYYMAVTGDAAATGEFKYIVHGQGYSSVMQDPNANQGSGSIMGHALDPDEITVGAVPWQAAPAFGTKPFANEPFSAPGPGQYLLDENGNPTPGAAPLGKPDVSGIDGVTTDVSGAVKAFSGTSAAAPSVAGVAALLLSTNPGLSPDQVKAILSASALPMADKTVAGAGLVQADAAVVLANAPTVIGVQAVASAPGTLKSGDTVTFTLTTSAAVTVTPGSGRALPSLLLNDGNVATFDSGASGGTAMVFRATVAGMDTTPSLSVTGLSLNGATVANAGTVALDASGLPALPGAATGIAVDAPTADLFDASFYLAHNPDVAAAGVDPFQHFVQFGWHEGRDPSALFHTAFYLNQNPDVAAAGVDPLTHYGQFGWHEGRDPSVLFSTKAYLAQNLDVAMAGMDPLLHYQEYGSAEGRQSPPAMPNPVGPQDVLIDPGFVYAQRPDVAANGLDAAAWFRSAGGGAGVNPDALFDTDLYLARNPDVAAAGLNPLVHYEQFGWHEGRDPSLAFSTNQYLAANPDVAAANIDPLLHYLSFGQSEGRNVPLSGAIGTPDPLVQVDYYDRQLGATIIPGGQDGAGQAAASYAATGWTQGLNPDALFNTSYYLAQNPDVGAAHVNPLTHYETYGWQEGRNPSNGFNTDAYLQHNPDVQAAGMDPLLHYLVFGQAEGRAIYPVGA